MLIECIPNVSEGRRSEVVAAMADAIGRVPRTRLLDFSSDPSHNRSVFTVVGDAVSLEQAVLALFERAVGNLVDNALRFTPDNGSIQIALAERATDFEVAVRDNGSGIAPEHLPRVFDRFYRAESSRGSDGAGLGLALVKSIVDLHGGTAKVQSGIGRGTIVSLTFPKCG